MRRQKPVRSLCGSLAALNVVEMHADEPYEPFRVGGMHQMSGVQGFHTAVRHDAAELFNVFGGDEALRPASDGQGGMAIPAKMLGHAGSGWSICGRICSTMAQSNSSDSSLMPGTPNAANPRLRAARGIFGEISVRARRPSPPTARTVEPCFSISLRND